MIDELNVPEYLRLTAKERTKAWENFKPKEVKIVGFKSDPRKPKSITDAEWEAQKEESRKRREAAEEEAAAKRRAKIVPAPIDTKGLRWDVRRSRWVKDPFAHLAPAQPVPTAPTRKEKEKPAANFGVTPGTNREKLAKAMSKRVGTMVTLKELSKAVYGKENEGPCFNVIAGFIKDLKKGQYRFEIIRDKNEKGEVTFGLFEL